jgi:hypothetical protein
MAKNKIIHLKINSMMDFIMVPLIVGIVFLGTYKLFELFARRKERLNMIEKIGANADSSLMDNTSLFSARSYKSSTFGTLKIACLLLGVGLGLLVGFFIAYYYYGVGIEVSENSFDFDRRFAQDMIGVIYGASTLLFGGLGLLVAFIVEMNYNKKQAKS